MIATRLTQKLGIRHPIVQAGMGGAACADLAAAVSSAGGVGTLGMIRRSPAFIREQIRRTRALTRQPFGVNLVPPVPSPEGIEAQFEVCLDERVPMLSFFWCDPAPFVERCHAAGILVMQQVGSAEEARHAVGAGVDVVIAQGHEAGGHVRGEVGLVAVLPAVVDAVAPVPVIAAGGIADGRGLAAALALGADAVWVGTRFVASEEAESHPDYKKRLVGARETDTIHTELFHIGWPPHSPSRVLRNALTEGAPAPAGVIARNNLGDRIVEVPAFAAGGPTIHTEGQTELMANYAGQGVAMIHEVLPAATIVERMVAEAEAIIRDRLVPAVR
ncbi:MAG: nitronate monooxygenase [Candidatus Rokubacteria bacterium]|nr:nitronate monooxygenase [Candidatus Rokubacteria bacterium]